MLSIRTAVVALVATIFFARLNFVDAKHPLHHPHHAHHKVASHIKPTSKGHTPTGKSNGKSTGNHLTSSSSSWSLSQSYEGESFAKGWDFWTQSDPTHGTVSFVDQGTAASEGLAYYDTKKGVYVLATDSTSHLSYGQPRKSVRITSQATFSIGTLVIADFTHTPYGCSSWPAFWLCGPNWPYGGEIDIFEGINVQDNPNQSTLHSGPSCSGFGDQTGTALQKSCDSSNSNGNYGCGVRDPSINSYGPGNAAEGGSIFAMSWTDSGIFVWRWNHKNAPPDVNSGSPSPKGWGTPTAAWPAFSCDPNRHFNNLQIIFDLTVAGDWVNGAWGGPCAAKYPSAGDAVQDPSNFKTAYFEIAYVKVYTQS
jgi:hypothetical protein